MAKYSVTQFQTKPPRELFKLKLFYASLKC